MIMRITWGKLRLGSLERLREDVQGDGGRQGKHEQGPVRAVAPAGHDDAGAPAVLRRGVQDPLL